MDEEKPQKKKSFWSIKKIAFFAFFLIAIIIGATIQHYVVEPFLGASLQNELNDISSQNTLLNEENVSCIKEKDNLSTQLNICNADKEKNLEKLDVCNTDLVACKEQLLE